MTNLTFRLADGRQLGYAVYGPQQGQPVLYFHGTPSSRLEPRLLHTFGKDINQMLQQYHIRLIAVDRPGMGLSSFHKSRTLASFAGDVHQLLQHLQVDGCQLLCWSGGGPYALAMASSFAQVIKQVCIISGFSSSFGDEEVYAKLGWNKMYFNTARKAPLLLRGSLGVIKRTRLHTPISQHLYDLSNADYALMKDVNKMNELLALTLKEACAKTADGAIQEAQVYFQPFPFRLKQINVPVHFWWGTEDNVATYIHAKRMEENLPQVTPHYKKGEGHFSVYVNYFEEALQVIASAE